MGAFLLLLLWPYSCQADGEDEQLVLVSGQFRLSAFYRERKQNRLTLDPFDRTTLLPFYLQGAAFQGLTDLDLHVENTLSKRAIFDFSNHLQGEVDSPEDIQGSRYGWVDDRFVATWGLCLDKETTLRTDVAVRVHDDKLYTDTNAQTARLSLGLDTALEHDEWLTFRFWGEQTRVNSAVGGSYREGGAQANYQTHSAREVSYTILPTPVDFPKRQPTDPAFIYGREAGLYESKKLFPLGGASMIGAAAPPPLEVSPYDRLFREKETTHEALMGSEFSLKYRAYEDGPIPSFWRGDLQNYYLLNFSRSLQLRLETQSAYQGYSAEDFFLDIASRYEGRLKGELIYTEKDWRVSGYSSYGTMRFPNNPGLNIDILEAGFRSIRNFAGCYWTFSELGLVMQAPHLATIGYQEHDQYFSSLGFTADFECERSLTVWTRYSTYRVPVFPNPLDYPFYDSLTEIRYRHPLSKNFNFETGVRFQYRRSVQFPENDRTESVYFLDSIVDL